MTLFIWRKWTAITTSLGESPFYSYHSSFVQQLVHPDPRLSPPGTVVKQMIIAVGLSVVGFFFFQWTWWVTEIKLFLKVSVMINQHFSPQKMLSPKILSGDTGPHWISQQLMGVMLFQGASAQPTATLLKHRLHKIACTLVFQTTKRK